MEQTKVEQLYDDPKSRGFVNHLIQSYLPTNKVEKIWDFTKEQKHFCNICNKPLMSVGDVFQGFSDNAEEFKKDLMIDLKKIVNEEPRSIEDHPMYKMTKGRVLGYTGENTNTCLCFNCVENLLEMTQNQLLCGDNNILYQVKKTQRTHVFNSFRESPVLNTKEKQQVEKIKKAVEKKKATFGDIDVLQKLKEKMENE